MSKVAIVKVEKENVEEAVRKAVDLLGGLKKFISNAQQILLKPNLLSAPKDEEEKARVRTDPRVVKALTTMLLEQEKKVLIGDNSGAGITGGTRLALKKSGYLEIQELSENVKVHSLEIHGPQVIQINGKKLKQANISNDFLEAEAVINIPKMKTHGLTLYTGAIKNLYGTICGADKTRIHAVGGDINGFSQCLVDLYAYEKSKIRLNVMDAIIAAEGMGPGVSSKPVKMNLILASDDAVALDAVAFTLMGHDPKMVPTTKLAAEQGLGIMDLSEIELLGEPIEKLKRKFKLPPTKSVMRLPFAKLSKIIIKVPKYVSGCIGCRNCENGCPKEVITIKKNRHGEPYPSIDYSGCISCFTCIEVCPEACYETKSKYLPRIIGISIGVLAIIGIILALVFLL
ncbi:MAG: DUF362 domain-containing protein [Asgard group archaeon]|nr:DUF362 domain-containing protein [Asgard group archaeon]